MGQCVWGGGLEPMCVCAPMFMFWAEELQGGYENRRTYSQTCRKDEVSEDP